MVEDKEPDWTYESDYVLMVEDSSLLKTKFNSINFKDIMVFIQWFMNRAVSTLAARTEL